MNEEWRNELVTKGEAIDALCKAGCDSGYCGISCDDVRAIENLPSAQPECKRECMPMYADVSDCISRQAAIDEAYEIIIDGQKFEVVQVETLMGLPSAQLQRIRAKWIYGDGYCKCSACGEDPIEFVETTGFDAALMNEENPMKFCPNCGADMRGKQDE